MVAAISLFALLISVISLFYSVRRGASETLTESCAQMLDESYKHLNRGRQQGSFPVSDRMNWLASARFIMRYYQAKKSIKDNACRKLCENNEEVYRQKFYDLLNFPQMRDSSYFYHGNGGGIYPPSAMVILEFAHWEEDTSDVLDKYDDQAFMRRFDSKVTFRGIYNHARRYSQYRIEERGALRVYGGGMIGRMVSVVGKNMNILTKQFQDWRETISPPIRFILCGVFSYFSFTLLSPMADIIVGKENELIQALFENPSSGLVLGAAIFIGYIGLFFSLLSATLFSSLMSINKFGKGAS